MFSTPRCDQIFGRKHAEITGVALNTLLSTEEEQGDLPVLDVSEIDRLPGFQSRKAQIKSTENKRVSYCSFDIRTGSVDRPGELLTIWFFLDAEEESGKGHLRSDRENTNEPDQRTADLEIANQMLQREIQARRRVEEKYRAQQSEMARISRINTAGEMVSALAHELGQPLAAMLNYTHGCLLRLATGNATNDELRQGLVHAVRNAEQAGEIVKRVRRFLHKAPPERRLHDVNRIIDEIAAFLDVEARRHEICLRIRRTDTPLRISVDRVEIEQVLVNLVKNAFEAMNGINKQPKIAEISCLASAQREVIIAVADNGPGVPDYIKESIFEPFFTTKNKGMGFGLAICNSLVTSNGGEMKLSDSWLGGALFEIKLPLGDPYD